MADVTREEAVETCTAKLVRACLLATLEQDSSAWIAADEDTAWGEADVASARA